MLKVVMEIVSLYVCVSAKPYMRLWTFVRHSVAASTVRRGESVCSTISIICRVFLSYSHVSFNI